MEGRITLAQQGSRTLLGVADVIYVVTGLLTFDSILEG